MMAGAAGPRPFRFGVVVADRHDAASWRERCRQVEDLGYASLHVPDTCTPQMGPIAALAAAAAHTTTLRLGMLVANNDLRHPAVLVEELATLDVLSEGRLEWGMGADWSRPDYRAAGLAFDPPGVRVERLIEAVGLMQRLLAGAPVTHAGRHYATEALQVGPAPVQVPHPPLLIGAAERRLLTFAAREADAISINRSFAAVAFGRRPPRKRPDEAVDDQVGWIRAAAGERLRGLELSMEANPPVVVTDDRRAAVARVAEATGRTPEQVAAEPRTWIGSVAGIVESLERTRERSGVSHWVVYEPYLRDAAPVVAALAGR